MFGVGTVNDVEEVYTPVFQSLPLTAYVPGTKLGTRTLPLMAPAVAVKFPANVVSKYIPTTPLIVKLPPVTKTDVLGGPAVGVMAVNACAGTVKVCVALLVVEASLAFTVYVPGTVVVGIVKVLVMFP
jgi:hypothetical protein